MDESGFTLVELVVSMVVIAVVITTLLGLQLSSLRSVALAKQRQTATALANEQVELLRSLPHDVLRAGLLASDVATDPWVTLGRLRAPLSPSSWDEKVVSSAGQTNPTLSTHVTGTAVGAVTYTVRRYVTLPKATAGSDLATSNDFWLTVVVQWLSPATGRQTKSVVIRNREAFPAGCNGTAEHPYVGPCQPFLRADAGWTGAGITVNGEAGGPVLAGSVVTSAAVVLPSVSAGTQVEQTTSAQARAVTSGTIQDPTGASGQLSRPVQSDIDPATGLPTSAAPTTVAQQSAGLVTEVQGSNAVLRLRPSDSDNSGVSAAAASSTDASACKDLTDNLIVTNQACASARIQPGGSSGVYLDLAPVGSPDVLEMQLAKVDSPPIPVKAYGARFLSGASGHCLATTGVGCTSAGVTRSLGVVYAGGFPQGASLPVGFQNNMVQVDNLSEQATAEVGVTAAAAGTDNRFDVKRSGTLRFWSGSGYTSKPLTSNTDETFVLPSATGLYRGTDNSEIRVKITGSVGVEPSATETVTSDCEPESCVAKGRSGALTATLHYDVTSSSQPPERFTVQLDLGSVGASTTYRAVP